MSWETENWIRSISWIALLKTKVSIQSIFIAFRPGGRAWRRNRYWGANICECGLGSRARRRSVRSSREDWSPLLCISTTRLNKHYPYNRFTGQLVGHCENWVSAKPVKNCFLATFRTILETYEILIDDGRAEIAWRLTGKMEKVYRWYHLRLKGSHRKALEVYPLSRGGSPASARDEASLTLV